MLSRDLRRTVKKYALQSLILVLVLYFLYHLIQGGRGLLTLRALESGLENAETELNSLKSEHDKLQNRVDLMKPGEVCPDLLEEQAKSVLGYKKPGEKIVVHK